MSSLSNMSMVDMRVHLDTARAAVAAALLAFTEKTGGQVESVAVYLNTGMPEPRYYSVGLTVKL